MRVFYFKAEGGNFGDDLNEWLWEDLLPNRWDPTSDTLFLGIGTLLGMRLPSAKRVVVFGSGAGYGHHLKQGLPDWDVAAVRGPLTARVAGVAPETAVADGALLISTLQEFSSLPDADRQGVVFVPHHHAIENPTDFAVWQKVAAQAGVELLDPRGNCKDVIHRLRSARLVLAESMHAAIISDTLRVPWVPVVSSGDISTFKWLDWSLSVEAPYHPLTIPSPSVSAALRDALRGFGNQQFTVNPPEPEAAMAHLKRMIEMRQKGQRKLRQKVVYNLPSVLRNKLISKGIFGRTNERSIDRASDALRGAAGMPGYLSADSTFNMRVGQLSERLDAVSRRYA